MPSTFKVRFATCAAACTMLCADPPAIAAGPLLDANVIPRDFRRYFGAELSLRL